MEEAGGPVPTWRGRHFDGRTAEPRAVDVRLDPGGLLVDAGDGAPTRWPFEELVLIRGARHGEPVQLERRATPVEVVVVDSPDFHARLRAAGPAGIRHQASEGAPAMRILFGIALAGMALLFALWRFGIPALADVAAERMPPAWEEQYGTAMLAEFTRVHTEVRLPEVRQPAALVQAALAPIANGERADRFVVVDEELPNAFALPGGNIVLTTGLLTALRSPDELAAVFAHEWGHVQRRHVLRSVFRQASLQLLLSLIAGDQSALSGGLRTAGELGSLSYSRSYEREADDEAAVLLASHGTSPEALAAALESIRMASPSGGVGLGFLSTHPPSAERAKRIADTAARLRVTGHAPWRDGNAWSVMKEELRTGRWKE